LAAASSSSAPSGSLSLPGAGMPVTRFHGSIFAAEEAQFFLPLSAPEAAPLLRATPYLHAPGSSDAV